MRGPGAIVQAVRGQRGRRPDMSSPDNQHRTGADSGLSYVPPAWLILIMGRSLYGLSSFWTVFSLQDLPPGAAFLIYGGVIAGVVTVLWGLYLLGLAIGRSARFPRQFTIWQAAFILWLLVRQAYILIVPDFVFSPQGLLITGGEIVIGLLCIYLLRPGSGAEAVYTSPQAGGAPSVLSSVIAAVLGILLGGTIGACIGLLAGSVIADVTHVSCFEGGCGYFALFIGIAGLVVGAIAGGIFAVWWVNRRKRGANQGKRQA